MDIADPPAVSRTLPPVVCVHEPHPHAASFAYSVFPWSEQGEGLIAFAPSATGAAELVNGVLRREPGRMMGDVAAISTDDGPVVVRLILADPVAADRYALRRADGDAPAQYLQIVPLAGRRHSHELPCHCCPDLSRPATSLWSEPFDAAAWRDDAVRVLPTRVEGAPTERLLLPVRTSQEVEEGRLERVSAELLDGGRVRLLQAPAIGDWTSAGAIHEVAADGTIGARLKPGLAQFGVSSGRSGSVPERWEAQAAAMDRLCDLPDIAVTMTGEWLTVAAGGRHAARARSVLRRLVRDGFARDVGSYVEPHDADGVCMRCRPGPWMS